MRIAVVITRGDSIGGAQVHVRDLALQLHTLGHSVCVFMGGGGAFQEALEAVGVPYKLIPHLVHPIDIYSDLRALGELLVALKAFRPDILTAHSSKAGLLTRLAGWQLRIPTVFTAHGWAFTEGVSPAKRRLYIGVERFAAPLATKLICVSDYDRLLAIKEKVGSAEQLVTIHNGVPDTSYMANPEQNPPRVIMVARLAEPKDHAAVFRALDRFPELHLDLVGDGPKKAELQALAASLGMTDRVHFLGHTDQVEQLLARAQIFVLMSKYEGFPLSILEAMRAGLPVIASDVGGVKEAVVEEQTGFIVPKGDVRALETRLAELIQSPSLRAAMGGAGRRRFLEEFTIGATLRKTLAIYQEVSGTLIDLPSH